MKGEHYKMQKPQKERSTLDQAADLAEELSAAIGNLAGTACLLRIELDDSDKIYPIHRQTMATIQTLLEHLEADTEKLTDRLATLQHEQMKQNIVYVPMSEYEAVNRDIDRYRATHGK